MKKLLPFLLAAFLPFSAQAQRQAITVEPNGTGAGTVSTAGITYYYMGANTYDFTGSILVNGTLVASATAVYYQVSQANSFVAGQPVTVNGSGTWVGAFANGTLAQANAVGVVSSTGLSAGAFQVVIDGICPIGGSALTTGSIYYVPLAAGIVTSTAPSVAGQYVYPLATAISPSILVVSISTPSIVSSFAVPLSGNNVWTGTNQFNNRVEIGPNGTSTTSYFSVDPAITVPGGVSSNMEQLTGVGTASGNSYATTGLLIQPNFTLGAFTGGNVNFVDIEAGGSTTGTPASGYMLKVGAPLSGMTGAFDVVSGAVNLGSGTITSTGSVVMNSATGGSQGAGTINATGLYVNGSSVSSSLASNNTWTGTNTFNNTVNGTGITALFASPPAIGGTSAAAGNFTALGISSTLTVSGSGAVNLGSGTTTGGTLVGTLMEGLQNINAIATVFYGQNSNASTAAGTKFSLANDSQQLISTITSSGYTGSPLVTGGIAKSASIYTDSPVPLILGTNGTLALTLDTSQNATFAKLVSSPHYSGSGSTPTVAINTTNAGTGATVSIAGNDAAGVITINSGTGATGTAPWVTVTFATAYATAPQTVLLSPLTASAGYTGGAGSTYFIPASIGTTTFQVNPALANSLSSLTFKVQYQVK